MTPSLLKLVRLYKGLIADNNATSVVFTHTDAEGSDAETIVTYIEPYRFAEECALVHTALTVDGQSVKTRLLQHKQHKRWCRDHGYVNLKNEKLTDSDDSWD